MKRFCLIVSSCILLVGCGNVNSDEQITREEVNEIVEQAIEEHDAAEEVVESEPLNDTVYAKDGHTVVLWSYDLDDIDEIKDAVINYVSFDCVEMDDGTYNYVLVINNTTGRTISHIRLDIMSPTIGECSILENISPGEEMEFVFNVNDNNGVDGISITECTFEE